MVIFPFLFFLLLFFSFQAARILEFVVDKYVPDMRTRDKLEMVLNIIRCAPVGSTTTTQATVHWGERPSGVVLR